MNCSPLAWHWPKSSGSYTPNPHWKKSFYPFLKEEEIKKLWQACAFPFQMSFDLLADTAGDWHNSQPF